MCLQMRVVSVSMLAFVISNGILVFVRPFSCRCYLLDAFGELPGQVRHHVLDWDQRTLIMVFEPETSHNLYERIYCIAFLYSMLFVLLLSSCCICLPRQHSCK